MSRKSSLDLHGTAFRQCSAHKYHDGSAISNSSDQGVVQTVRLSTSIFLISSSSASAVLSSATKRKRAIHPAAHHPRYPRQRWQCMGNMPCARRCSQTAGATSWRHQRAHSPSPHADRCSPLRPTNGVACGEQRFMPFQRRAPALRKAFTSSRRGKPWSSRQCKRIPPMLESISPQRPLVPVPTSPLPARTAAAVCACLRRSPRQMRLRHLERSTAVRWFAELALGGARCRCATSAGRGDRFRPSPTWLASLWQAGTHDRANARC